LIPGKVGRYFARCDVIGKAGIGGKAKSVDKTFYIVTAAAHF
jgi:hypothetical protein